MTADNSPLRAFYEGWSVYQAHLIHAIAPLSDDQLTLGAAPHLRPIGVLAAHIIAGRVWWFHYVLGEGGPDLAPLVHWDDDDVPPRTAAELVNGLETSWQTMQQALSRWTSRDLAETVRRQVRGKEYAYPRQWVIWHVIEHDLHHGGELSFTLGMHGLAALDMQP
jgi:uncharacterized damage-inducible protein DinB